MARTIALLAATLALFSWSLALADPAAPAAPALALTGWPGLVVLGLMVASYCMRRFAPEAHWFHTAAGAVVLAAACAVLAAVTQTIQSSGLSGQAVLNAAVAALGSFLASSNPSSSAADPVVLK